MIMLHALPLPLSHQQARPATHRKTAKERENLITEEGGRGWGGAESYDSEKAWSSIKHSILSAVLA
jgi:hypothetical protein